MGSGRASSARVAARRTAESILSDIDSLPATTTPAVRTVRRNWSRVLARETPEFVLAVADGLLRAGGEVSRFVAYEVITSHRGALRSLDARAVKRLGRGMATWGEVDCFAVYISGPAWREGQIADDVVKSWTASRDRWWRRAALVSTVALNSKSRGGVGDAARTIAICRMLLGDRDDMVVKAMSWALRELAKREPIAAEAFLDENESVLAARVLREVRNKLRTGLKNPGPG